MKHFLARGPVVIVMFAIGACGGATTSVELDAGAFGGSSGTGGSGNLAGIANTSGSGGVTGSAGSGPDVIAPACALPMAPGPCDAFVPSFWHNPANGVCQPFVYGGCGGNANRFATLDECQRACHGGQPDMDACGGPGDCVLLGAACCGACGAEDGLSFVAVARAFAGRYAQENRCNVACGECVSPPEEKRTAQYYTAECRAGSCVVVDVRTTDATKCVESIDCQLRDGLGCCAGCDGAGLVALSTNADIGLLTCGNQPIPPCAPCPSPMPTGYVPRCVAGRCTVTARSVAP